MKFWKVVYLYKSFSKWIQFAQLMQFQSLQRYALLISQKMLWKKANPTLERLVEQEWDFVDIQVFMRAFYDSRDQRVIIFSSKVFILLGIWEQIDVHRKKIYFDSPCY